MPAWRSRRYRFIGKPIMCKILPPITASATDGSARPSQENQAYWTTVADLDVDGNKIVALWRTGLSHSGLPEAKLKWYYRNNIEGTPLVVFLHHAETQDAVGVAAVGPRRMRFGAETLMAGALVDFVTQPEHRTFFPAIFLQKELRRRASRDCVILFGFPNTKALPVVRRVGYKCVGQMVRRTRVLRSAAYLANYLPSWLSSIAGAGIDGMRSTAMTMRGLVNTGFQSHWQERPDNAFDDLWRRAGAPGLVMGVRDSAFLIWRFVDVPFKSFMFFTLVSSVNQRLVAYAVCEADGEVLRVADFLVDPNFPAAGARLWLDLSREAIRMGHTSLCVEFMGADQEQRQLNAAGFIARDKRPVYASVTQSSTKGVNLLPTETSVWYLTPADDDS